MTAKKQLALACIIIALLVVGMTKQHLQIKALDSQIADIEIQQQIRSLINDLRIPSEVLYRDHKASKQIFEIRRQAYEKMQIKEFLPYTNVFGLPQQSVFRTSRASNILGEGTSTSYGSSANPEGSIYCPAVDVDLATISNASLESFWLSRMSSSIRNLKFDLDENLRLGKYYNEHPDEFDKVVKPWVLRMTRSTHVDTSMKACEILLKRGCRDEEIIEAVRQVIERSPSKDVAYSSLFIDAMRLNDLYKLGIDVPADEPANTEQGS